MGPAAKAGRLLRSHRRGGTQVHGGDKDLRDRDQGRPGTGREAGQGDAGGSIALIWEIIPQSAPSLSLLQDASPIDLTGPLGGAAAEFVVLDAGARRVYRAQL